MAGVSVRTLHHYDHIGLLKPETRTPAGHRMYGRGELLRLQQIMLCKEVGMSLDQTQKALDDPSFQAETSLQEHRKAIEGEIKRLQRLLSTIDKTFTELKNKINMTNEELYAGFSSEQAESYRKEAIDNWGQEQIEETEEKLKKLGRTGFTNLKKEGDYINQALANSMHLPVDHPEIQLLVERHFRMTGQYFDCSKEAYSGLGKMYVEDERFTAFYEKTAPGLASYLNDAIQYFVTH